MDHALLRRPSIQNLAPKILTKARNLIMRMLAGMRTCTSVILHAKSFAKNTRSR
jgi:hypothetical protein